MPDPRLENPELLEPLADPDLEALAAAHFAMGQECAESKHNPALLRPEAVIDRLIVSRQYALDFKARMAAINRGVPVETVMRSGAIYLEYLQPGTLLLCSSEKN